MPHIETSDKSFLKLYRRKTSLKEQEEVNRNNPICQYCGTKKRQVGRYFVCACSGANMKLPSGKPFRK